MRGVAEGFRLECLLGCERSDSQCMPALDIPGCTQRSAQLRTQETRVNVLFDELPKSQ